jgi:hypothetical protein
VTAGLLATAAASLTSFTVAVAVNCLVIEASSKTVSGVTGASSSTLASP